MSKKPYKVWVYSDPHFYHANIVKFRDYKGDPLRPWDDVGKMTEDLISMYNELVSDQDRVYILGDVAFNANRMRDAVSRLKGRKVLVPGNHEPPKMRKYFDVFDDVRGYVQRKGFVMSHVPLHPDSLERWGLNIHSHLHDGAVRRDGHTEKGNPTYEDLTETVEDERYYCACVERTNFRPKLLNEILEERGLPTV